MFASIGAFFTSAAIVIRLLPEIWPVVRDLIVYAEKGIDWAATRVRVAQFAAAVKKAKETKDTTDVENIFHPRPRS